MENLQRKESNHTYEISITLANLQSHQIEELNNFIKALEENGIEVKLFNLEND